jgi:hypothetical protein
LQVVVLVEGLAVAVDPAVAEGDVEGFGDRDRRPARPLLGDLDPDFARRVVVLGQPGLPLGGVREVDTTAFTRSSVSIRSSRVR